LRKGLVSRRASITSFKEAPIFYWLYTILIGWEPDRAAAARTAVKILIFSQVGNGFWLGRWW